MFRKNQNENTEVKKDLYLIERIQPAGGISFSDEKYVSTGTGYEACIHIFSYKKKISDHWLKSLTDIENTIVTLDVKTDNIDEVKRNLKYYGGIVMASQSIRDYVPEGSSDVAINKIKTVFELTQYKFLFYQDNNTLPLLDMVFGNQLTYSQKQAIPRLEQGETILAISGGKSLKFKVYLTKEEERIFDGGL